MSIKSSGYFTFLRRQAPAAGFSGTYTGFSVGGFSTADKFVISASSAPDISQLSTASYEGVIAVVWKKNVTGSFVRGYNVPNRLNSGAGGYRTVIYDQVAASTGSSDLRTEIRHVVSATTDRNKVENLPLSMSTNKIHRTVFAWRNNYMYTFLNGKLISYKTLSDGTNNPVFPYRSASINWEIACNAGATPLATDEFRLIAMSFDGRTGRNGSQVWDWDQQVKYTGNHQLSGAQYHWEANDWAVATGSWADRVAGLNMLKGGAPVARSESLTYENSFEFDPHSYYSGSIIFAYDLSRSGSYVLDASGTVERITDFSGLGNHLTGNSIVTTHPRIANLEYSPAVVFDGVNDLLFASGVNLALTGNNLVQSTLGLTAMNIVSGGNTFFYTSWTDVTASKYIGEMLGTHPRWYHRIRHWGGASAVTDILISVGPFFIPASGSWGHSLLTQLNWTASSPTISGSAQDFNVQSAFTRGAFTGPAASGSILTWGNGGSAQPTSFVSAALGAHFVVKTTSSFDDYLNFQAWTCRKGWI